MNLRVVFHAIEPQIAGVPVSGLHRTEVAPRTENPALARQDDRTNLFVSVRLIPGVRHSHHHLDAERVLLLGPVEGANREMAALLIQEMGL